MEIAMEKLLITKEQLDAQGYYAASHSIEFTGQIEIAPALGCVKFRGSLIGSMSIFAGAGSGIEAGGGIKAGDGIKAGWGIEAGGGIEAGDGIKAGSGIKAGEGIEAGSGIEAGDGIKAGEGIKAGSGIEAGWGIEAGLQIVAKTIISAKFRIFAGLCIWRLPNVKETAITAQCIEGEVCYGKVKLLPAGIKKAATKE